ncbi:MAG: DUF5668 domain-containing protein [Bryobacteraceae bacterium]
MADRSYKEWAANPSVNVGSRPGVVAGLVIVAVGTLMLLGNFGLDLGMLWRYWPVVLVAIGLAKLVDSADSAGRTGGAILLTVGLIFLGNALHLPFLEGIDLWRFWPIILIIVGISMLLKSDEHACGSKNWTAKVRDSVSTGYAGGSGMVAVFDHARRKITGEFPGGEILSLFGAYDLDLREATMAGDEAVLTANAIFGGIDIRVPREWIVTLQSSGVFSGQDDRTRPPYPLAPNPKRLLVQGSAVFGGLNVRN